MAAGAPRVRAGRALVRVLAGCSVLAGLLVAVVAWLNLRAEAPVHGGLPAAPASAAALARGAYLARAGNCMGCHTASGGAAFAGGRGIETPFGLVMAPNITPDLKTGIGTWSESEFWRAMHHGRGKDGRLLYPAFPYPSFTYITRADSDSLYAYLRALPAVEKAQEPHALRFPFGTQAALAVWRALYFRPGQLAPEAGRDAHWHRGRYLVQGLGHCAACHSGRNALGGSSSHAELAGGWMPDGAWYAPSLASPREAGVQGRPVEELVRLLKTGVSGRASASGPMAEVVANSTQHLSLEDLGAMARYLASIPVREAQPGPGTRGAAQGQLAAGGKVYEQHCAHCHGEQGQGVPDIYPALAGNRAVSLTAHNNLVQIIRLGGFMPTTAGNRQPFGMPPFGQTLSNEEIAAVTTYIRQSWGNAAPPVSALDVLKLR